MKKITRYTIILLTVMTAIFFTACSNIEKTSENETKAKTGEEQTPPNKEMKNEEAEKAAEDIWVKYKGINAVDAGLKGIKVTLADVAVTDKAEVEEDGKTVNKSVVAVHMLVKNTTADRNIINLARLTILFDFNENRVTSSRGFLVNFFIWQLLFQA